MDTQKLLGEVAGQLLSGAIEVVDLSAVLGPDTPLIKLPPDLAVDTPKIEIHKISAYDKNGPWWAWNWLKLGEHSGTHFDAPQALDHRQGLSGRRHRHHSGQEFRRPGQCDRLLQGSGGRRRLPAHRRPHQGLGSQARRHQSRRMGGDAHRLVQAQRFGSQVPQRQRDRPAHARTDGRGDRISDRQGHHRLGQRDDRHRCRQGRRHGAAVPGA